MARERMDQRYLAPRTSVGLPAAGAGAGKVIFGTWVIFVTLIPVSAIIHQCSVYASGKV